MEAWDEHSHPLLNEVGELVITKPMPSMPVAFWGDDGDRRYLEAYFDTFPGIWRHGDWVTITTRGSVIIHGRSDSTLNRNGVRMGSAEIYSAVERLPEVSEALIIGAEQSDGGYWMPLFVCLVDGQCLDDRLQERIRTAIREHASPRHLPDEILEIAAVPHTRTGKKLEIPVKRILQGAPAECVADPGAVDNPESLQYFVKYRAERLAGPTGPTPP
jgi:acetoacetyl-CoA synthetase